METWEKMGSVMKSYCSQPDELLGKFGFDCNYYHVGEHEEANFGKFDENLKKIAKADLKKHLVFYALKK